MRASATLPECLLSRPCAAQFACLTQIQFNAFDFPAGHFAFGMLFLSFASGLTFISYAQEMETSGPASLPPPPVTGTDASDKLAAAALSAALVGYTACHFGAPPSGIRLIMVRRCFPQTTGSVMRSARCACLTISSLLTWRPCPVSDRRCAAGARGGAVPAPGGSARAVHLGNLRGACRASPHASWLLK